MDSITQIVLGAAVAEATAGKKLGNKAALWGAVAGTIPDLDVFLTRLYHPVDAALVHRGFSHSILFAVLAAPVLGWLLHRLYKKRYEQKTWIQLFFWGIITHPMLDMFTNYGTEFLWPLNYRITFNSVFVIDPLYTLPFLVCLVVALFLKKEDPRRRKWNWSGIIYSTAYLLYGVVLKLSFLYSANDQFAKAGLETRNAMVTPMPLTSFYWMILAEDDTSYYVGYRSLFYPFDPNDIDTIQKNKSRLNELKWPGKNYSKQLAFISNGYYTVEEDADTVYFYDLRFGITSKMTNELIKRPLMGYKMVIDNGIVQKTERFSPSQSMKHLNFEAYVKKVFSHE